ncbi:uncharacterized protein TNCV_5140831 [Trichonephila clavipes]|nr:uncharacterized protein TNCV_5140831 [Trichonephila clavipes]
MLKISPKKTTLLHWKTNSQGLPDLAHLSIWRENTWRERRPIRQINHFFIPELNNHDVQELWFQQDGATCHTARATIDLSKDTFGDRLISRFGPGNWPPRSCDLTPLDYFLWGYVKSLVYADKPQTLDHLEDNIRRVIADIRPQMLEKVIENWTSRLDYIRASSPMTEILFKISSLDSQNDWGRVEFESHHRSSDFDQLIEDEKDLLQNGSEKPFSVNRFLASKNIPVDPQPSYSPDLSPCDSFLFPKLKNHLKGHHFGTLENIQTAVTDQLKAIPTSEFHQCYEEWKKRLQRCVASEGSYFEGDNVEL